MLASKPKNGEPIKMNGKIYAFCGILKFLVASAVETDLRAFFLNVKEGKLLCIALQALGHKHLPTSMHCDNVTATDIARDTIKKQPSRSMEMRLFWITDQVNFRRV
jgi:hypothetical protein